MARIKLTKEQVLEVVELLNQGKGCKEIGDIYGLSLSSIYDIKIGKSWSGITGIKQGKTVREQKKVKVLAIAELLKEGLSAGEISKKLDVTARKVTNIKYGRIFSDITGFTKDTFPKNQRRKQREVRKVDYLKGSMTNHAKQVYDIIKDLRDKSRTRVLKGYHLNQYRAELNHKYNGEEFTVFEAEKSGKYRYVCYGDNDTFYTCSWKILMNRLSDRLSN